MQPPDVKTTDFVPPERPLILVGASVRAAAQSAVRAGFRVTGVDSFGDTDTRSICENYLPLGESIESQLRKLHGCRSVPLMIVGGLDQHADRIGQLSKDYSTLGPTPAETRTIRSLEFLRQIAQDTKSVKVPAVRTPLVDSDRAERWLSKHPDGSGGLRVRWAGPPRQPTSPASYEQKWVPGRPHGATLISDGRSAKLLGVCSSRFKRLGSRPFVYAGSDGPIPADARIMQALSRLGAALVQRTGITGLFNIDVIVAGRQLWLLEINPRWSASCELIERSLIDQGQLQPGGSLIGLSYQFCKEQSRRLGILPCPESSAGTAGCRTYATDHLSSLGCEGAKYRYLKRVIYSRWTGRFDCQAVSLMCDRDDSTREVVVADLPADAQLIRRGEPIATMLLRRPIDQPLGWQKTKRLFAQLQKAVQ